MLQEQRVVSGPARVIASGEVTTFDGHGLAVAVPLGARNFTVRWAFTDDENDPAPAVHSTLDEDSLALSCVNFAETAGRGSAMPVLCARDGDSLLFLHFRVFRYGRTLDYTVHYTLYLVDADAIAIEPYLPTRDA